MEQNCWLPEQEGSFQMSWGSFQTKGCGSLVGR